MLKKTIKYTDYDGNEREEDFYFNLTKAEILDWMMGTDGNYTIDKYLEKIVQAQNGREIIDTFKDIIWRSYGEKSLDGRRFIKNNEIKDAFVETEAYSQLFTELVTDASKAAAFVNGIIPQDVANEIANIMRDNPNGIPDNMKDYVLGNNNK